MLKCLSEILPQPTTHGIRQKRVFLSQLKQIQTSHTTLQEGETTEEHSPRPWRTVSSFSAGERYQILRMSNEQTEHGQQTQENDVESQPQFISAKLKHF